MKESMWKLEPPMTLSGAENRKAGIVISFYIFLKLFKNILVSLIISQAKSHILTMTDEIFPKLFLCLNLIEHYIIRINRIVK